MVQIADEVFDQGGLNSGGHLPADLLLRQIHGEFGGLFLTRVAAQRFDLGPKACEPSVHVRRACFGFGVDLFGFGNSFSDGQGTSGEPRSALLNNKIAETTGQHGEVCPGPDGRHFFSFLLGLARLRGLRMKQQTSPEHHRESQLLHAALPRKIDSVICVANRSLWPARSCLRTATSRSSPAFAAVICVSACLRAASRAAFRSACNWARSLPSS